MDRQLVAVCPLLVESPHLKGTALDGFHHEGYTLHIEGLVLRHHACGNSQQQQQEEHLASYIFLLTFHLFHLASSIFWSHCPPDDHQPGDGHAIDVEPEGLMHKMVQPDGTQHVGGQDAEVDKEQPVERPVEPVALRLQPECQLIARQGNDIGVGLRTVAEQDDIAHNDGQCLHPETEVAPPLVAPEEQHSQDGQHP